MKTLLPALCFLLCSPLFAEDKNEFRAGAALSNITPKMGVPLDGTIMQIGPAKHVHDELWARCIVISDGTVTLAFATVDNTMISREVHDAAKRQIQKEIGIPPGQVCISATHTHSTPRAVVDLVPSDLHREYLDFLAVRIADGVRRAHNNLAPAEMGTGNFEEARYVHNRRWHVKKSSTSPFGDEGETVKMNPSRTASEMDKPAGPVDPEVYLLALRRRSDQQPIALLANYGLHYVGGIPGGTVSADYFGVFADHVQRVWKADRLSPPFVGIMSNGTSGDVNANDFRAPRVKFKPYERMTMIADDLAGAAGKVLETMTFRSDVTLSSAAGELTLDVRKPDPDRLAWAEKTKAPEGTRIRLTRPQIYAREAGYLTKYPDQLTIPLQVFRIGDLAIAQSPCETFAETGLAIKKESPFAGKTFTIELANGYSGYLPPREQFNYGGYETWPARSSMLEKDAETKIRAQLLALIKELHQAR